MRLVRRGSRNASVKTLQSALNAHGYGPLVEDGIFGRGTQRTVIQFQQSQGLAADGIVGPQTWRELLTGPAAVPAPMKAATSKQEELLSFLPGVPDKQKRALRFAINDLGKAESPLGSNRGRDIDHIVAGYDAYWRIGNGPKAGYPWCAIAASHWTGRALGLGDTSASMDWKKHPFGHWFGGVSQIQKWAKDYGRFDRVPLPGHIFTMPRAGSSSDPSRSTKAGHCGLVVHVDNKHIVTLEGNVSNANGSRVRRISDLNGFARWW